MEIPKRNLDEEGDRKTESNNWKLQFSTIDQIMKKDFITVLENDFIELVAKMMNIQNIRHVPVENEEGILVGLMSSKQLIEYYSTVNNGYGSCPLVKQIMVKKLVYVPTKTLIIEAIQLMEDHHVGCLPVVKKNKLVGLITECEFVKMAALLLQELNKDLPTG